MAKRMSASSRDHTLQRNAWAGGRETPGLRRTRRGAGASVHTSCRHLRVLLAMMTLYMPKEKSATEPTAITSDDGPPGFMLRL